MKILIAVVAALVIADPIFAQTITGKVSNGYYWQRAENGRYLCRSVSSAKFQKHEKCEAAGAKKP